MRCQSFAMTCRTHCAEPSKMSLVFAHIASNGSPLPPYKLLATDATRYARLRSSSLIR
jgi:hypothetical protein